VNNLKKIANTLSPLDVNIKDFANKTPLYYACELNSQFIVTYLLNSGANINVKCVDGDTALHVA